MIILEGKYSFFPAQKYFSSAGFAITQQGDKYYVDLPRGWTLVDGRKLLDERKRIRGHYDEQTGYLALSAYYRVVIPRPMAYYCGVVDYLDRMIYVPIATKIIGMSPAEIFSFQCRNFLETYYPQWKNPNAYW